MPRRRLDVANDEYQVLHALLSNRKKRRQRGAFLVHGVRPISEAVRSGWPIELVLVDADRRLSSWAAGVIESVGDGATVLVAGPLMSELAGREAGAELVAVATIAPRSLDDITIGDGDVVVVLDRPASPGNLGTIIRSADAFGAAAVVITGHAADPYDPQCVRASTGSLFSVPVIEAPSFDAAAQALDGLRFVAADETGQPIDGADLSTPLALVFGTEGTGLARAALERCAALVAIPMRGSASSLNVASAAAIVLHEVDRRRRANR